MKKACGLTVRTVGIAALFAITWQKMRQVVFEREPSTK